MAPAGDDVIGGDLIAEDRAGRARPVKVATALRLGSMVKPVKMGGSWM